jgi:hypothetical protein
MGHVFAEAVEAVDPTGEMSIAFMTLLDGALIPLLVYVTMRTYLDNLVIEAFVGAAGAASIAGLFILRGLYDRHAPQA